MSLNSLLFFDDQGRKCDGSRLGVDGMWGEITQCSLDGDSKAEGLIGSWLWTKGTITNKISGLATHSYQCLATPNPTSIFAGK